jgi:hypothetical protein
MKTMAELATENEKQAKQNQKLYYDRKARDRKLEVGQKVLILLPTHTSKLLASWKGPFVVTDKVNPVDYKVKVRGGKGKVVHVNMLKVWHERVEKDKSTVFDSVLLVYHVQWQALPLFSSFLLCLINDLIQNVGMYSVLPIPL